jgi:hypothetical protein
VNIKNSGKKTRLGVFLEKSKAWRVDWKKGRLGVFLGKR